MAAIPSVEPKLECSASEDNITTRPVSFDVIVNTIAIGTHRWATAIQISTLSSLSKAYFKVLARSRQQNVRVWRKIPPGIIIDKDVHQ